MPGSKKCVVCEVSISHAESLKMKDPDFLVCRSHRCQALLVQRDKMPLSVFGTYLKIQKEAIRKQKRLDAKKHDHIEQITHKEQLENSAIHYSVANQFSEFINEESPVLAIPTGLTKTSKIPSQRIYNYRLHLKNAIAEAMSSSDSEQFSVDDHTNVKEKQATLDKQMAENPGLKTISDHVCSFCKGGCCANGGDNAYIEAITIKRYVVVNPEVSADEILEKYLSCLVEHSVTDACINQTPSGCCLPRELRSDVCNAFYCDPLKAFHEKHSYAEKLAPIVVIQRTNHYWNRFEAQEGNAVSAIAIVDEQGAELVDPASIEQTTAR